MAWTSWYALKAGPGAACKVSDSPSRQRVGGGRTDATEVTGKAKFLKHHLVAMCLQGRKGVRLLGEHEAGLGRIASLGRLIVEELAVPYLLLRLPAHDKALFNRATESYLAKVPAFLQLGPDIGFSVAVSRKAVWDNARPVRFITGHKPGFDSVGSIVENEGGEWCRRTRRPRLSTRCHGMTFAGVLNRSSRMQLSGADLALFRLALRSWLRCQAEKRDTNHNPTLRLIFHLQHSRRPMIIPNLLFLAFECKQGSQTTSGFLGVFSSRQSTLSQKVRFRSGLRRQPGASTELWSLFHHAIYRPNTPMSMEALERPVSPLPRLGHRSQLEQKGSLL